MLSETRITIILAPDYPLSLYVTWREQSAHQDWSQNSVNSALRDITTALELKQGPRYQLPTLSVLHVTQTETQPRFGLYDGMTHFLLNSASTELLRT